MQLEKLKPIEWKIDPLTESSINERIAQSSSFAQAVMRDRTEIFFETLRYKIKMRELITLEIKGMVRGGKSSVGFALAKYISSLTGILFGLQNVSKNDTVYLEKLRTMKFPDSSVNLIDEQTEKIQLN